ncbi:MAG: peptide chain release factor N(5)-glutamine methyltransferase [Clostridia bacterium]|nr:peptide chain release factor N(5)-glutamine methyltransferase [Clostridia bacterium]
MTFSRLYRLIREIIGGEANEFCRYFFKKEPAEIRFCEDEAENAEDAVRLCERIKDGEPMQYIFGSAYFYGLEIMCKENVLIPRSDTETVVMTALKALPYGAVFADICCGTGCIAAAILRNRPDLTAVCADVNPDAVDLTKKNLAKYGLSKRAEVVLFDVFSDWSVLPDFDCVVSNPPYVKAADMAKLPDNVRREPYNALYGGEDGLDFYKRIIKAAKSRLADKTHIIFEIGYDEAEDLYVLAKEAKLGYELIKDLSDNDRAVVLKGSFYE